MIPEPLAGQKLRLDSEPPAEAGRSVPLRDLSLTLGSDAPVQGGDQHVLAGTCPLSSFGDMGIDGFNQFQPLGQGIKGRHRAELKDLHCLRFGSGTYQGMVLVPVRRLRRGPDMIGKKNDDCAFGQLSHEAGQSLRIAKPG